MEELKIIPRCKQGEYGIITVAGQWQPCCNFYTLNIDNKPLEENVDIFNGSSFSIEKTKDSKFHQTEEFKQWIIDIENNYQKSPDICKYYCCNNENSYYKSYFWNEDDMHFISNQEELLTFMKKNDVF